MRPSPAGPMARIQLVLAALVIAGLACAAPLGQSVATVPPGDFETALAGTIGAAASQTAAVLPTGTATPTATLESTATITLTPTPEGAFARLTENTHCRKGPLAMYDLVATFLTGEQLSILGKNSAGDYWYVKAENGKECWMWGRYAEVSGNTGVVPVFTPPPTPMPNWTGTWSVMVDAIAGSMTLTQSGNSVTGTLTAVSEAYSMTGTVSNGGVDLSGEVFSGAMKVADFDFHMLDNRQQFRGMFTDPTPGVWCGGRGGAGIPSPCGWP
ncbi:MAG: SH3 domain-containing protein [Anaerolineales bacterium]